MEHTMTLLRLLTIIVVLEGWKPSKATFAPDGDEDRSVCYVIDSVDEKTKTAKQVPCAEIESHTFSPVYKFDDYNQFSLSALYNQMQTHSSNVTVFEEDSMASCPETQHDYALYNQMQTHSSNVAVFEEDSMASCDETQHDYGHYEVQYAFTFLPIHCGRRIRTVHRVSILTNSSSSCASVKLSFPLSNNISDINITLSPGSGQSILIPEAYPEIDPRNRDPYGEITNTTIVISAIGKVHAYAFTECQQGNQASAFRLLDVDDIGTNYWVMSYHSYPKHKMLAVVSIYDNTSIQIHWNTSIAPELYPNNITILLNKFQTYTLALEFDPTGVQLTSNKPISVFSGHTKASIPATPSTDPIAECLKPVEDWGRVFSLTQLVDPKFAGGYIVRILSSSTNNITTWKLGGNHNETTLAAGEFLEVLVDGNVTHPLEIVASNKVLVVQFTVMNDHTSPVMLQVPSQEHHRISNEILFPVFDMTDTNTTTYLTVWLPPEVDILQLSLNERAVWKFIDKDSSEWSIFQTILEVGFNRLAIQGNGNVHAIVYSYGHRRAYAYTIA
ncbi:uncharacterized protein [Apostichopus japonicus]|uniref:uncharacterized protein n=1 Tax=Stichopus japonicus TaxID=307972 RepID=UPI003AB570CC